MNGVVPYITARAGEVAVPLSALRAAADPQDGRPRLGYRGEAEGDRDLRGVLWARCAEVRGADGLPDGEPLWRMVHPARQRECMQRMLCQLCARPAVRTAGFSFSPGPVNYRRASGRCSPPSPRSAAATRARPPLSARISKAAPTSFS